MIEITIMFLFVPSYSFPRQPSVRLIETAFRAL